MDNIVVPCFLLTVYIALHKVNFSLVMVALWNRADHYIFMLWFVMAALCNRAGHYIFAL